MKRLNKCYLLAGLLVILMGVVPACAQVDYSTATLKGTVADPQGAVVVGATVTATNSGTGVSKSATTDGEGRYQIAALPPGAYDISVEAKGFSKQIARNT
ncbi:MAG TPA: carboxypeptidase-like regulatory domain-containing protein, partial [Candidatus Angelobacter sp.]|nr:carboxypeptidase-like regulatory domain-containing protein [Candidatus Angelobacter sp.]